jgi:hypothetical protein
MASGYSRHGVDLDDLFMPIGSATPGPATGKYFRHGVDLSQRFHPSLTLDDTLAYDTGYAVGGVDLRYYFRRLTYVAPPVITTHPVSDSVGVGVSVTFTVVATGDSLSYQWLKDGEPISGATSDSYNIPSTTIGDAGAYQCDVSNSAGFELSDAAILTIEVPPSVYASPSDFFGFVGDTVELEVGASGSGLSYQWQKLIGGIWTNLAFETSSTLVYSSAATGDSGTYRCVVTNAYGSDTSGEATVLIEDPSIPPEITGGSVMGGPYNFTTGDVANFNVIATGAGLSYQWYKDGVEIPGATGTSYDLGETTGPSQSGTYKVIVTNSGGTDEAEAILTVTDP